MKNINIPGFIVMIVGGVICYGAKPILSILKVNIAENNMRPIYLKAVGLIIAIIGFVMIMSKK